jgi:hypothetical protein
MKQKNKKQSQSHEILSHFSKLTQVQYSLKEFNEALKTALIALEKAVEL